MLYQGPIYDPYTCPYADVDNIPLQKRCAGNPRARKKYEYKDCLCAFDIETTGIPEIKQSVMYIWQFGIEGIGVVIGRTWEDFVYFLGRLRECRKHSEDRFLIYVHNLSYEFQFLKSLYNFGPDDVFAVKARKILKCVMFDSVFEFRCSYLQSNMSLDNFCVSMGVEHEKIKGFDYSKLRWPDTPLSEFEISYCIHDVVGLIEAMRARLTHGGDNFYTIPLTSTGYARRDTKKCLHGYSRQAIRDTLPDWRQYTYLRRAFRGGNTHANRHYAGLVLTGVKSADRSSSYPDVLLNRKYPMSAWFEIEDPSYDDLTKLINVRKRACLVELEFESLRLSDPMACGCPYLSIDKCDVSRDRVNDNGRILSASHVVTVLTDVDFRIVESMYEWDAVRVLTLFHARYGYLPKPFRDLIKDYYVKKTGWKNVPERDADYRHSKELINSLYGMTAQAIKPKLLYVNDEFIEDDSLSGPELMADYHKRAFLSYNVGVWCTAWARYELQEMINLCGRGFVYTDTDSVKYLGDVDFTAYNARCIANDKLTGGLAKDPKGNTYYLGVAEYEGEYAEFKTLGAKKYVYTMPHPDVEIGPPALRNRCYITIAGVNKIVGGIELDAAGGIEQFKEGFTFRAAGGLEATYNDSPDIYSYTRADGVEIPITSNVYLGPSEYTLGIAAEYRHLLEFTYLF